MRSVILLIVFLGQICFALGQGEKAINGKIVDSKSGDPVPFASIRLKGKNGVFGVVSNSNGDFQIPARYRTEVDTIRVSCIGYLTLVLSMRDLKDGELNTLRLRESVRQLSTVVIKSKKGKRLSAERIVQESIDHIPDNYPQSGHSYIAYYRDYQLRQNQYINLNEAIVEVFDEGFNTNDYQETDINLYDYKRNLSFQRDSTTEIAYDNSSGNKFVPGAFLPPYGGNELTILRIHDAVRNYNNATFSFVYEFAKDFLRNHFFKKEGDVFLQDIALYQVSFESRPALQLNSTRYFSKGKIYIEHNSFAIHKFEYEMYLTEKGETKMLFSVQLEYSKYDELMHLNYISFSDLFMVKDPGSFEVIDVLLNRNINAFVITFNNKPTDESALDAGNYHFRLKGAALEVDHVSIPSKDEAKVAVYLKDGQIPIKEDPDEQSKKIEADFNGIVDEEGREVNKIIYFTVNQFRELFAQGSTPFRNGVVDSLVVDANKPLSECVITKSEGVDISNYWMNTPLKEFR